jgi:hypothetical protein
VDAVASRVSVSGGAVPSHEVWRWCASEGGRGAGATGGRGQRPRGGARGGQEWDAATDGRGVYGLAGGAHVERSCPLRPTDVTLES